LGSFLRDVLCFFREFKDFLRFISTLRIGCVKGFGSTNSSFPEVDSSEGGKRNNFSDPNFLRDLDCFRIFSGSETTGTSGDSGWALVPFLFGARVSNVESPGEKILQSTVSSYSFTIYN
jgi:hypothetical protein